MSDSHGNLAALVYAQDEDPDRILHDFAADLNRGGGRAVGLVQLGHHRADSRQVSALLVHTGEKLSLFQDLGKSAEGCRVDVGQLLHAAAQISDAIDRGADVVIVNRFGRQEREGKGLVYLIERALSAGIPVVIAVPSHRFADWIKFVDGMSVKLPCDRESLDIWWNALSKRNRMAYVSLLNTTTVRFQASGLPESDPRAEYTIRLIRKAEAADMEEFKRDEYQRLLEDAARLMQDPTSTKLKVEEV